MQAIPATDSIAFPGGFAILEYGRELFLPLAFDRLAAPSFVLWWSEADPTLAQISAQFTGYDVERSGGGYIILNRGTSDPIARLRSIADTDRFEVFYRSNVKGRWTTFSNMGRMKLMLESAHKIIENDPMFRISRRR